jgi:hypothetical protein
MQITIPKQLTPWQSKVYGLLKRFNIIRAGRRTGKTRLAVYALMRFAITHANSLCWFVALDVSTCVELAMPEFLRVCPPELIQGINRQTRTITLINGSQVVFKTAESTDALRGRGIDFVVLEEFAFWKHGLELWNDVLSPQLMGRNGIAVFISSPNGSNFFRRMEDTALYDIKTHGTASEWAVMTGTIYDNPYITKDEIERRHQQVPEITWRQEYMAEYVDEIGPVYWHFDSVKCVAEMPIPAATRCMCGADWGIDDKTAFIFMYGLPGDIVYVSQEYVAGGLSAQQHAVNLQAYPRLPYYVMDSAAWHRESDMSSVPDRFGQAGVNLIQATKEFDGSLSDVLDLVANNQLVVNPKCKYVLEGLREWQHGQHEPDALAAMRYGIHQMLATYLVRPPIKKERKISFEEHLRQRRESMKGPNLKPGTHFVMMDGFKKPPNRII